MIFFDRQYLCRRFGAPFEVQGTQTADYNEAIVQLCIQKQVPSGSEFSPEGQRKTKKLNGWSDECMIAADDLAGTKGDWLQYDSEWYECISCEHRGHSPLHHYRSEWTRLPGGKRHDNPAIAPKLTPAG